MDAPTTSHSPHRRARRVGSIARPSRQTVTPQPNNRFSASTSPTARAHTVQPRQLRLGLSLVAVLAGGAACVPVTAVGTTVTPVVTGTSAPLPVTTTQYDDTSVGTGAGQFSYAGAWSSGTGVQKFKGTDHYSSAVGSSATFTFTGAQARIYGALAPQHGIAEVDVDGVFVARVDLYAQTRVDQALLFTTAALTSGTHRVKLVVTGGRDPLSSDAVLAVDRADVRSAAATLPAPVSSSTVDDNTVGSGLGQVQYPGDWTAGTGAGRYLGDDHYSNTSASTATFRFHGTQVSYFGALADHHGIAAVSVDGRAETLVDLYAATRADNVALYTSPVLLLGDHTLTVRVSGMKNPASTDTVVTIDRLTVASTGTTTTTAPPVTAPPTSGQFTVSGNQIIAPNGKPFIPMGTNVNGPQFVWQGPTIGQSAVAQNNWHFNTIRLDTCWATGCENGGGYHFGNNDNYDGIIQEYSARHIVTMVDLQQFMPGDFPSADKMASITTWWTNMANRYKGNPYVWFNLLNEPGNGGASILPQWNQVTSQLTAAIRGTGAKNIIVADGAQFGQEANDWGCGDIPYGNSAILTYGKALETKYTNMVYSLHAYSEWGGGSTGCSSQQLDTRLGNFIDRVKSAGVPMLIGEVGTHPNQAEEQWYEQGQTPATQSVFRVAPGRGTGVLTWHGDANSGYQMVNGGNWSDVNSATAPSNLTWIGQLLWSYSHKVTP